MYRMINQENNHDRRRSITLNQGSLLFGFVLLFILTNSWAADNSSQPEKIHVSADHMQLNIETGYSVYTGNVKISQGELVLTGDKVTLKTDKEEVQRMTVTGKPARYNHVTEKGETIEAESNSMVYTAIENKLVMKGNAKLQQPDHKVASQMITYDTLKKIVIAGKKDSSGSTSTDTSASSKDNSEGGSRVNITLTPKKKASDQGSK